MEESDPYVDPETQTRALDLMERLWTDHMNSGFPGAMTYVDVGFGGYKRHRDTEPISQADLEWLEKYLEE